METSWYGLFNLSPDETVEMRVGDLQEFLRQQMMGVTNPGLEVEVKDVQPQPAEDRDTGAVWDRLTGYIETIYSYQHNSDDLAFAAREGKVLANELMEVVEREAKEHGLEDKVKGLLARCDSELDGVYPYDVADTIGVWAGEDEKAAGGNIEQPEKDVAEHAHDPRSKSVRDWYMKTFPTDELGAEIDPDITFDGALSVVEKGPAFYDSLGVRDSLVRERVFMELSERYDIDYGDIYESWLNSKPLPDHALLKTALGEQVYEDMKAAMEPHIAEFEESLDEVLASMRESSSALDDGRGGKDSTVER